MTGLIFNNTPKFIRHLLSLAPIKRIRASLFIQRVSLTLITRLLLLVLSFITSILTARYLGPEGRGILAVTTAIVGMGVQFGNMGLHASNTYHIAKDKSLLGPAIGNTIWVSIGGGLIIGFLVTGFFYVFPQLVGGVRVLYIAVAALGIPFGLLYLFGTNLVLGIQHIKVYNGLEIIQSIINVIAVTVLLVLLQQGAFSLIILSTVAVFILSSTVIIYLAKISQPVLKFNFPLFQKFAGYGIKSYLATLFMFGCARLSMLMVNYIAGTAATGIYSIVVGIADYAYMIPASIGMILFPQVTGMSAGQWQYSRQVARGTAVIMAVICILLVFLIRPFINIFYGQEFIAAADALLWLLPGIFLYSINTIFMNHFAAKGLPAKIILSPLIALIATIGLNLYFIPRFGISGAAMVTSISNALMFIFSVIYLRTNQTMKT